MVQFCAALTSCSRDQEQKVDFRLGLPSRRQTSVCCGASFAAFYIIRALPFKWELLVAVEGVARHVPYAEGRQKLLARSTSFVVNWRLVKGYGSGQKGWSVNPGWPVNLIFRQSSVCPGGPLRGVDFLGLSFT